MSSYDYDIGIIGGGAAGLTTASGAAQLGAKTVLIEKESSLGGDCLHFGCVPSKTLIHSAKLYHQMQQGERFGLPAISPPTVDFTKIADRIQSVINVIQVHDSVKRFNSLGVEVLFGSPRFIDEHSVDLSGKQLSARSWVIATGSSPAPPGLESLSQIPYITNKEIFSLSKLPRTMLVLGGGPIAIEMAQAFNRLGAEVIVVQRSAQILSREDTDMASIVMERLKAEGITFYLNATVTEASSHGTFHTITIQHKGKSKVLSADTVLLAQGRVPNTGGLGLSAIDLAYSRRGITVDRRMRTSHKHIYAPGDINGSFQFTHAAGYEGGIVVSNAIFRLPRKTDTKWMPWCTYTDPELASMGMNEKRAQAAGIAYTVLKEEFADNDRAIAEGTGIGIVKLLLDKKERPLGIQIAGPRAGDLISEWVAILNGGIKLSTLAGTIHPYPTLGEINKRIASSYISPKLFSTKVQKVLKILFSLQGTKK